MNQGGLAGWFWFRVSHEVAVKCQLGPQPSEGLTGAGGSTSKVAQSCGCWQEVSVLHAVEIFIGCMSLLPSWQLVPSENPKENKGEAVIPFMTQSWKSHTITSAIFFLLEVSH